MSEKTALRNGSGFALRPHALAAAIASARIKIDAAIRTPLPFIFS